VIIQGLLIAGLFFIVWYFLRMRNSLRFRAGKKLLFLVFIAVSALSVIFPDELNVIAHFVGISRGADLLLYGLIVAFIFTTLNIYLKFSDSQQKIAALTREVTLLKKRLEAGGGEKKRR
jgi:small membrane protein